LPPWGKDLPTLDPADLRHLRDPLGGTGGKRLRSCAVISRIFSESSLTWRRISSSFTRRFSAARSAYVDIVQRWRVQDGRIVSNVATCAALYDVVTDKMVHGHQGAFESLAGAVKATAGSPSLKTFPVEARDGAIWLLG
jgi:hypothetical protein